MYIAMVLAHWTGSGAKGAKLAEGLQLGPRRDPGGEQGAERIHVPVEVRYLVRVRAARHFARAGASRAKAIPKW